MFNNKDSFEKIFLVSVLITFIGTLLPWVNGVDRDISGIEILYGGIISTLLLVSLSVFYFAGKKEKLVSIVLVVIGILSFLLVLRSFTELGYAITPLTGIFIDYGIGVYITALGSIGIAIAGIVGLKDILLLRS